DRLAARLLVEPARFDGDGEGTDTHRAEADLDHAELRPDTDVAAGGLGPCQTSGEIQEVLGTTGEVEADEIGAEETLDDLGAPRQLHEQLDRRERDVQEEAD